VKKIEAVIFDWAGTTVDYGCFAPVQAFIESFKEFGITPTFAEVREPMGMLKWDHISTMMKMPRITEEWKKVHGRMWTKEDVDEIYAKSEKAIFKILHNFSTPKPFVKEAIAELRSRGIKIGSTTGYTDEMMSYVIPAAKEAGYEPDAWFTPNSTNNIGRPYPYMIYRNMEKLKVSGVDAAIKVGDTVADIKEGKSAGLISVGIVEGSSIMGLSEEEYEGLSEEEKNADINRVKEVYKNCGADYVIMNMSELIGIIDKIESESERR
jgi:phosphonoacetaldehyde hydrolase